MDIEKSLFLKYVVDYDKLVTYGFIKEKDKKTYCYFKNILEDTFQIKVEVVEGLVIGKVYDLELEDEYINFRVENNIGEFAGKIRDEFEKVLIDIRNNCFNKEFFIGTQTNRISDVLIKKYGDIPSFEWDSYKDFGVFKNKITKKWYALIMNIDKEKLGEGSGNVEIINVKINPSKIEALLKKDGFYPAYHMNKKYWISIILDESIKDEEILSLIEESYEYASGGANKSQTEWIVPANPKYYDIEEAFEKSNIIDWKQGAGIGVGDTVYIYIGQPVSSIVFKCRVVENNIPFDYHDGNVNMKYIMKIELQEKYDKNLYTFHKLNEYGVNAVRSARFMPKKLSDYINKRK